MTIRHLAPLAALAALLATAAPAAAATHPRLWYGPEDVARLQAQAKTTHAVVRGSWSGCVISYRNGGAGSCRRDRMGRARNAFTVLWDNGWVTDEEVATAIDRELARRGTHTAPAAPRNVPVH